MTRFRGAVPAKGYRSIYSHEVPLPEVPVVTHISESVCTGQHQREAHPHEVFEIVYVLAGKGERSVGDQRLQVGPGDVYVIRPGEGQGARADHQDPYHFFAIGFDPAWITWRAGQPGPSAGGGGATNDDVGRALLEADTLDAELRVLDQRVIHGGGGAEHIFRRILGELDRMESNPRKRALTVIMVQALVVELLVFVTRCSIASRERATGSFRLRTPVRSEFQDLLRWLQTRLDDPPSLAEMSARVRLSPAHFTVAFKREVGQTPLEHLTTLRIEEGARVLAEDAQAPVTRIAMDLGFSSSQYFSYVFRRIKGCTPRQWRTRNRRDSAG